MLRDATRSETHIPVEVAFAECQYTGPPQLGQEMMMEGFFRHLRLPISQGRFTRSRYSSILTRQLRSIVQIVLLLVAHGGDRGFKSSNGETTVNEGVDILPDGRVSIDIFWETYCDQSSADWRVQLKATLLTDGSVDKNETLFMTVKQSAEYQEEKIFRVDNTEAGKATTDFVALFAYHFVSAAGVDLPIRALRAPLQ